jgi:ferrous iron transport protein A
MTLLDLSVGQVALVKEVVACSYGQGLVTRLEAMEIFTDKPIQVLRKAVLVTAWIFSFVYYQGSLLLGWGT